MPRYWLSSQILLPKEFPVAPVVRCGNPQCAATVLRGGLFQLRPIRFPARGVGPGTSSGVGAAHPAAALRGPLVLVQRSESVV